MAEPCGCLVALEEYNRAYSYLFVIEIYAVCPNTQTEYIGIGSRKSAGKIGDIKELGVHIQLLLSLLSMYFYSSNRLSQRRHSTSDRELHPVGKGKKNAEVE